MIDRKYSNGVVVFQYDVYAVRLLDCLNREFQRWDPKHPDRDVVFNFIDPGYCIDRIEPEDFHYPLRAQDPWPEGMPYIGG